MNMPISLDVNLDVLHEVPPDYLVYRVAVCWSSSNPNKKVLVLASGGQQVISTEQHKSFIRWADDDVQVVSESGMLR